MTGLIICSASKREYPCAARDLYTGTVFEPSRKYCELLGIDYFILSAKHGLVHKNKKIKPYECNMQKMRVKEKKFWGYRVAKDLMELEEREFLYLGSEAYMVFIPYLQKLLDGNVKIIDFFDGYRTGGMSSLWKKRNLLLEKIKELT